MIIPAILEKEWEEIEKKLEISKEFASHIHIDFIDGKFTNNLSYLEFDNFKKYSDYFNLEAHLMVDDPASYLDKLSDAGFKTFLGHVEKMPDQVEFVARGEELGEVGLALDIDSSIDKIRVSLDDLDRILLMSVKAGKSGQTFNPHIEGKIKKLRNKYKGKIEIDGGINKETFLIAKNAGVDMFCVTSYLFKENPEENFRNLEKLARGY